MASQYIQQLDAAVSILDTYVTAISDTPAGTGRLKKCTFAQITTYLSTAFSTMSVSTSVTSPLNIGGTAVSSSLNLQSTSGIGSSDAIIFKTGNNGATSGVRVSTSGSLIIGTTGQTSPQGILSCHTDTPNSVCFARASANSGGINLLFQKARGTTLSPTAVAAGDTVGNILFQAYNDAYRTCANISAQVDTGVGATGADMPGVLIFSTTPDGSEVQLEGARLTSSRDFGVGTGSTVSARIHAISTTEQLRVGFDASNYLSTTVSSAGVVTFASAGASPSLAFAGTVSLPATTSIGSISNVESSLNFARTMAFLGAFT